MATTLEFHTLTLANPDTTIQTLSQDVKKLKTLDPQIKALYLGQTIEDPSKWLLLISRTSPTSSQAWPEALTSAIATKSTITVTDPKGDTAAALNAPCTEFVTFNKTDDDFLEKNMKPFFDGVEQGRPEGFHGSAYGAFEQPSGEGKPEGTSVRMVLGWDSKEAHEAQRGDDKLIDSLIPHVSTGHQGIDMFHVNLSNLSS